MSDLFGWAVLGLGKHTRNFLAPAIIASASGRLVAIGSRDAERARTIAVPWGQPAVHTDLDSLLGDPAVDGVLISTPNHLHLEQVERVAAAGKHVLCEKPLATTAADAEAAVAACRVAGVALGVGFHLRHNRVHIAVRDAVHAGRLGELRYASIRYSHRTAPATGAPLPPAGAAPAAWRTDPALAGGGAFMGNGVHTIDLLRYLTGTELTDVVARADAPDGLEKGLVVSATLRGGALASLYAGDLPYPFNDIVLSGTEGTAHVTESIGNLGTGRATMVTGGGEQEITFDTHDVYVREIDDFVSRVRSGRDPDASGIDGLRSAQAVEAIYSSAQGGAAVVLSTSESTHTH